MNSFAADLHIHTALSPCAADEMTPPAIVQAAVRNGLSMIAICDHNSAGNTAATVAAGGRTGRGSSRRRPLTVLAGIEITTAEEVHVVGLFPSPAAASACADQVRSTLPDADDAYTGRFGHQHLMDADGRTVGAERKMLAAASTLDLSAAVELIHRHGGLAIAAHVNRPSFGVMSQLGVFPTDTSFDAIEMFSPSGPAAPNAQTAQGPSESAASKFTQYGLPIIASSDSHFLGDIGRARSVCDMEAPTFEELVLALREIDGRRIRCA